MKLDLTPFDLQVDVALVHRALLWRFEVTRITARAISPVKLLKNDTHHTYTRLQLFAGQIVLFDITFLHRK